MKMYNEEGSEANVDKKQIDIFFEAGWSLQSFTEDFEPSENKEVEKPKKTVKRKLPVKKIAVIKE